MSLFLTDEEVKFLAAGKTHVDAQLETIKSIQPPILIRERGDGTFVIDRWQFEYDPNWPVWEQPEWPKPAAPLLPAGTSRVGVTWK